MVQQQRNDIWVAENKKRVEAIRYIGEITMETRRNSRFKPIKLAKNIPSGSTTQILDAASLYGYIV